MSLEQQFQFDEPLTHQQMLMWTGQQLNPTSPIYNMAFRFELPLALDEAKFVRAFSIVTSNSPSLNAAIEVSQGIPIWRKCEHNFELSVLDFSGELNPEVAASAWCDKQCKKLLDLSERLFDSALIKISSERYVWFFNQHHVASDAWTASVIFELQHQTYQTLLDGLQPEANLELFKRAQSCPSDEGGMTVRSDRDSVSRIQFFGNAGERIEANSRRVSLTTDSNKRIETETV